MKTTAFAIIAILLAGCTVITNPNHHEGAPKYNHKTGRPSAEVKSGLYSFGSTVEGYRVSYRSDGSYDVGVGYVDNYSVVRDGIIGATTYGVAGIIGDAYNVKTNTNAATAKVFSNNSTREAITNSNNAVKALSITQ